MFTRLTRGQWLVDGAVGFVFFLLCLAPLNGVNQLPNGVLGILFAIALVFRRFSPTLSLGIAWAAALIQMYVINIQPAFEDLAILGVLYTNARWGERRIRWIGFGSVFVGAILGSIYLVWGAHAPTIGVSFGVRSIAEATGVLLKLVFDLGLLVGLLGLPWTAGTLVRTRATARESKLAEQNAQREAEAAEADVIVEQERNRIARDMHDVVAHSLAVVIAQADGARYAKENDPQAVDGALSAISSTARDALADVRLLLGQLRHPQTEGPQPALGDLERLLDQLRGSGLTVEFTTKGQPLQLGTGQQLAVYRIVQEALTNALRHGDRTEEVTVRFEWHIDELQIRISSAVNASPATAELRVGHGLAGMKERAALVGGRLSTQVDDRRFVVVATIPATVAARE
ncbi:MAG TPA: histidine kinase [Galbitalea sp.]|jgi:signal transduction histidine kinase